MTHTSLCHTQLQIDGDDAVDDDEDRSFFILALSFFNFIFCQGKTQRF